MADNPTSDNPTTDSTAEPASLGSPWEDLEAFIATGRAGGLTLSPDGKRLLLSVSRLDKDKTGYKSAWWNIDLTGSARSRRITRAIEGDGTAAFTADGGLLFTSKRSTPPGDDDDSSDDEDALWYLPGEGGEAYVVARRVGGFSGILTAREGGVLVKVPMHDGVVDDEADAKKRAERKKKKISAILHEVSPVRFWDHDLGPVNDRISRGVLTGDDDLNLELSDLSGDVGRAIGDSWSISDDGSRLVLTWEDALPGGEIIERVAAYDVASGERTIIASDDHDDFAAPIISADGTHVACVRSYRSTPTVAARQALWLIDSSGTGRVLAADWDRWAHPVAFSPDNTTLYVVGDEDGDAPVFAIDLATDEVRRLTGAGAHSSVLLAPDGATLYAVRSSYAEPGAVVAIDTATGTSTTLPSPLEYPELPGTLQRVETAAADGVRVPGYLITPEGASADNPAPLALWIHGGPLGSWNAWSWRWCPWLLVSQGYAVLLPDPALSTGYGQDYIQRGWGQWGGASYTDIIALTDATEQRADIDAERTVAMGGSYGGYMANWVAGHTDRFKGIVTHASLWNLESFGGATDAPFYWAREMTEQMRTENSPHLHADNITTPMLVIHGDKDYRVPIGEGLSLWWDLVSRHSGSPEDFEHKFLYFPDENHWILTPQHAKIWYQTVLAFINNAIGREKFTRPELL